MKQRSIQDPKPVTNRLLHTQEVRGSSPCAPTTPPLESTDTDASSRDATPDTLPDSADGSDNRGETVDELWKRGKIKTVVIKDADILGGLLAVHPSEYPGVWAVTHVPTGLSFPDDFPREIAYQFAQAIFDDEKSRLSFQRLKKLSRIPKRHLANIAYRKAKKAVGL